jgi:hypothetical protein
LEFPICFFLTLLEIAVEKDLVDAFISSLRALLSATGEPAEDNQAYKKRRT